MELSAENIHEVEAEMNSIGVAFKPEKVHYLGVYSKRALKLMQRMSLALSKRETNFVSRCGSYDGQSEKAKHCREFFAKNSYIFTIDYDGQGVAYTPNGEDEVFRLTGKAEQDTYFKHLVAEGLLLYYYSIADVNGWASLGADISPVSMHDISILVKHLHGEAVPMDKAAEDIVGSAIVDPMKLEAVKMLRMAYSDAKAARRKEIAELEKTKQDIINEAIAQYTAKTTEVRNRYAGILDKIRSQLNMMS